MSRPEDTHWSKKVLSWLRSPVQALFNTLFQLTCFALLAACLYLFGREIMAKQPRYELLISLGTFTLLLALAQLRRPPVEKGGESRGSRA